MNTDTINKIDNFFLKNAVARGIPSKMEDIICAEKELEMEFDKDYVFFLLRYGGSLIGEKEVYGLHNCGLMGDETVVDLTKRFREDTGEDDGWLVMGTDYTGNPIGIDKEGKVMMLDYDFGETSILAESLEVYILQSLCVE